MASMLAHSPVPPSKSLTSRDYVTSPAFSDQHSQLDDILSDLMSDKAFNTDQEDVDSDYNAGPQQGSITRHDGNNRTVVSWQKSGAGPSRSINVSSHSVSKPTPNSRVESERQHTMSVQRFPGGSSWSKGQEEHWVSSDRHLYRSSEQESKSEINKLNASFGGGDYKPLPPTRRRLLSNDELESAGSRQAPPYRKELNETLTKRSESKKYHSDTEEASGMSWLDSQRRKLNQKQDSQVFSTSKSYQSASESNRVMGRRDYPTKPPVHSYDSLDELSTLLNESSRDLNKTWEEQQMSNKRQKVQKYHQMQQRSCSVDAVRTSDQKTEPCFFVSGLEKPAFSKQQTKYVFCVSPSPSTLLRDDSLEDKFNRSSCLSPPPPKRGDSSKEAVQRRHAPSVDELDQTLANILKANSQPPETDLVIEEEVISLEPIGRGIHTLEPNSDTLTLTRSRSRAETPVYPGFPTAGYRSPSLSRMQEGFVASPGPGLRSPTPGRGLNTPSFNGPATREFSSGTLTSASYKASSARSNQVSAGRESSNVVSPTSPTSGSMRSLPRSQTPRSQTPSRLNSREEDLDDAVSFMMANAEPFKRSGADSQQNTLVKKEVSTTSTSYTENNPPTLPKKTNYLEQQHDILKQQQQLLLQSQQLQKLQQQEKELKEKQLQVAQELQQCKELPNSTPQKSGWIVKEETITRTTKNSNEAGNPAMSSMSTQRTQQSVEGDLERQMVKRDQKKSTGSNLNSLHNASSAGYSVQQQQQVKGSQTMSSMSPQQQQSVLDDLESQMVITDQKKCIGSNKCNSSSGCYSVQQQQQQHCKQNCSSSCSNQVSQSSNAVKQLDDISKQMQDLDSEIEFSSAVSRQQRQQAVSTKFGSQQHLQQQQQFQQQRGLQQQQLQQVNSTGLTYAEIQRQNSDSASELRNATNGMESSTLQKNNTLTARSPSPSLWTNEMLRSYTARKHSSSPSPLLPPGSTLPSQGRASPYFGQTRAESSFSMNESDTLNHIPRFVGDSSRLWHRPNITREEAVSMLKDKPPGSFIVRNSSTFQGAYGLALKVAQIPPNVQLKGGDPQTELVRHFLIEPTVGGVRLKGCSNEPVFSSLAALVYQHTLTPLALPCKLLLPEDTEVKFVDVTDSNVGTVSQGGAACNVQYLNSIDTESLTGPAALTAAIHKSLNGNSQPKTTIVQFKVSPQGITLTDHQRSIFFRRHYPMNTISYCGIEDGSDRRLTSGNDANSLLANGKVFGFVARKAGSVSENVCHIFIESDPSQPASAIVDFMTKIMVAQGNTLKP